MKKIIVLVLVVMLFCVLSYMDRTIVGYRGSDGLDYIVYIVDGSQAVFTDRKFVPISSKLSSEQIDNLLGRR